MGTSDITVTVLTATPGIGHSLLKFTVVDPRDGALPAIALDAVEVHAATTNDRSLATKIDEGKDKAAHMALPEGQTRYYWARARNRSGNYGDWYPSGATSGVRCTAGFSSGFNLKNGNLVVTAAAGALTIALKTASGNDPSPADPVTVSFTDEDDGNYEPVSQTAALSIIIPSGATLGASANAPLRVWIVSMQKSAAEFQFGVINCVGSARLDELFNKNSTAIGVGASAVRTLYSTTSTSGVPVPYRIVGWCEWDRNQNASPGTWVAPERVKLYGIGMPKPGDSISQSVQTDAAMQTSVNPTVPFDDSIPTSSEGFAWGSFPNGNFTPNATEQDYLHIQATVNVSHSVAARIIGGVRPSGQSWEQATWMELKTADDIGQIVIDWLGPFWSVAGLTTYQVMVGASANGTLTINGRIGARLLGGALKSSVEYTVIMG